MQIMKHAEKKCRRLKSGRISFSPESVKWIKREQDDRVSALITYYGFSAKKAREALGVLSEEAIAEIQKLISIGGKLGKSK